MKRMAALFAVMGALSAIVPAAAPAATTSDQKCLDGPHLFKVLRFC